MNVSRTDTGLRKSQQGCMLIRHLWKIAFLHAHILPFPADISALLIYLVHDRAARIWGPTHLSLTNFTIFLSDRSGQLIWTLFHNPKGGAVHLSIALHKCCLDIQRTLFLNPAHHSKHPLSQPWFCATEITQKPRKNRTYHEHLSINSCKIDSYLFFFKSNLINDWKSLIFP